MKGLFCLALAALLLIGMGSALALVDEDPPPALPGGFVKWLGANTFVATLLFLVLATLMGSIISRMVRDRCLRDFEGYPVTLELKNGNVYHGELDVERTGLEFFYEKTTPQKEITKTSYLIFQPEYGTIHALVRYHDSLNDDQMRARERAAKRAYHPGPIRRSCRAVRNFVAGVKDSVVEAFGLVMGRMKGIQAAAPLMQTGGAYIDRVGKEAIGTATDITYDPLIEKQIGLRVVLQLPDGGPGPNEYVGAFREYTKDFFELLGVDYESKWEAPLPAEGSAEFVRGIAAERTPDGVHIENCNAFEVTLAGIAVHTAEGADQATEPPIATPAKLPSGEKLDIALPPQATTVVLTFRTLRQADIITPRTGAFIRHKSEWAEPRKLIGTLRQAVGLLPRACEVVSRLAGGKDDARDREGEPS